MSTKKYFNAVSNGTIVYINHFNEKSPVVGEVIHCKYDSNKDFVTDQGIRWVKFYGDSSVGRCFINAPYEQIKHLAIKDAASGIWISAAVTPASPIGEVTKAGEF